ncbi:ABC transporter ATP-binding protein [Streptomyces parvulus]|uniref:ABC transporter ATP-binding protein n=1 Tax=Streptomyces parvulus TaxID=146923 RepID=A0A369UWY6_9ACTN|nr:ABC transporter ATP-binding protein [Streptomyces parvulus]RDD85284.1 ABC transporter ATP-binding protein [Streptomyces parvulus]
MNPTTKQPQPLRAPVLRVSRLKIARAGHGAGGAIVSGSDFTLAAGESVGIVGESGSGKSMTAKALTGLLPAGLEASGVAEYGGRNLLELNERDWRTIRGSEIGTVMQDPFTMLNPVMRCGHILTESLAPGRRLSRAAKRAEAVRRLSEVGISDPSVADRYPFQLSGGMRQRVAIAAALARDPQVLIADEPSTALDVVTQREVLALIKRIQQARGMSLILITHDLRVAFATCDRIHVLYAGSLVEAAAATDMQSDPQHPYTQGLLLSEPPADRRVQGLVAIPGSVPAAGEVEDQCPFAARCQWARPECRDGMPKLELVAHGHESRCLRLPEIRTEMAELRVKATEPAPPPAGGRGGTPLIEVEHVEKVFTSGGRTVRAVDDVSLTVSDGESVGIVGESGSGKTTLARMLVGLETPSGGEIVIDGVSARSWSKLSDRDRRRLRGTVQTVFQDPYSSLNPMRTVGWTLQEAVTTHHRDEGDATKQVGKLLESVGLPREYAQRRPAALSGGERQRVAIARALAARPRLLICDEPVSALDMSVQAQILNLLEKLRDDRGISYLFITHDLSIVRQASEYLYVMNGGRVVESGPTEGVLDDPEHAYTGQLLRSIPRADGNWLRAPA